MDFVYTPEGREEDPYRWEWRPGRISSRDAEIIERRTGMTFPKWTKACYPDGSMVALHALLFVMLRKDRPELEYDQVEFTLDEVHFEYTEDDERTWLANLEAAEERGEKLEAADQSLLEALRRKRDEAKEPPDPTEPPGKPGKKAKSRPGSD
jgi:hypothetical protein